MVIRGRHRGTGDGLHSASVRTFKVEDQVVRCVEDGGDRLGRCEFADLQKRLSQFGEGFCDHTVVAITRCFDDGSIEI